jgi:hypothetical protein
VTQLIIDDEFGPIGPGGMRALMTALMGTGILLVFICPLCFDSVLNNPVYLLSQLLGPGLKGGPYKLLKSFRVWRSFTGDEGAAAIAEVLRLGGAEVQPAYLELLDVGIGPKGCMALGQSLAKGKNLSLCTLKLDYNVSIGGEGAINVCRGLRTNMTLIQLHLSYCNITQEAGPAFAELLENSKSALEELNLTGNRLGGVGFSAICRGLAVNTKCERFSIADNMIDQSEDDMQSLVDLRDVLFSPNSGLTHINLMYNRIGEAGAMVLAPALGADNKKVKEFLVDLTLPMHAFDLIFRRDTGGKGKKGKKGKKK